MPANHTFYPDHARYVSHPIHIEGKNTLIQASANEKLVKDYQHLFSKTAYNAQKEDDDYPRARTVLGLGGFGSKRNIPYIKYFQASFGDI